MQEGIQLRFQVSLTTPNVGGTVVQLPPDLDMHLITDVYATSEWTSLSQRLPTNPKSEDRCLLVLDLIKAHDLVDPEGSSPVTTHHEFPSPTTYPVSRSCAQRATRTTTVNRFRALTRTRLRGILPRGFLTFSLYLGRHCGGRSVCVSIALPTVSR